jgi:hypothetical protein
MPEGYLRSAAISWLSAPARVRYNDVCDDFRF